MSAFYRKRVLEALADAMERNPEQRVGQVIANALSMRQARLDRVHDVFYVPDDELTAALVRYPGKNGRTTP